MSVLLYRNYFYRSSVSVAEGHFGVLVGLAGVGYACAALVTPPATRRLAKPAWITLMLAASAVVTLALGETFLQVAFLAIGFCLYLTRQGVAICAVTILQEEVDDAYRGRVFAFYDMMFNAAYVAGAALSVAVMPASGHSPLLVGLVAAGFAVVAAAYWLAAGRGQSSSGSAGGGGDPLGGCPAQQFLSDLLPAQLALGDAQLEQEAVRLPHQRARRHAQDAHDLVAVELGPEAAQLLLLAELGDALLELVVGAGQPGCLGPVPGGAVGPGQHVQPGEQRPGVADVPADRRSPSTRPRRSRGTADAAPPAGRRPG